MKDKVKPTEYPKYRIKILKLIAILLMLITTGCTPATEEKPHQSVLLFRDKDGLYRYDFATGKEKLLYKLHEEQIFLDSPCEISGDTLTFGMVGQRAASTEYEGLHYMNYYISVNLRTGENWESRKISYSTDLKDKFLNIKTESIDRGSRYTTVSDTTMPYHGYADSYRGMFFNEDYSRFYTEHTVGNKKVYSENGSLYCLTKTEDGIEGGLLAANEYFNPKFGNGFLQPQLDPSGTYVICTFMPLGLFKKGPSLNKITLADQKMQVLKEGRFIDPQFSGDGAFVLFRRNAEQNKAGAWESGIFILNLKTLEETGIGKAGLAQWMINDGKSQPRNEPDPK